MTRLIRISGKTSKFQQVVPLDGEQFTFRFRWNARTERWFLTIRDASGTDLVTGRKLVANVPFAVHETVAGMPPGDIWVLDTTGAGTDPGLRDLGDRVIMMYVDEDNVG